MAPVVVAPQRTWRPLGDGRDAPNVLEVDAVAGAITFAMDFSDVLNPGENITSVDAVAVVSGTSLTTGTLAVSNDARVAHADITLTTTTGERKVRWTVTASGGNAHIAEGWLNLV